MDRPNETRTRSFTRAEASLHSIVPPAVWHGEASFHARLADPTGRVPARPPAASRPFRGVRPTPSYTPAVRRWVCVIALLYGFSGDRYAWSARPRLPVPIERTIRPGRHDRALPEEAWWRLP